MMKKNNNIQNTHGITPMCTDAIGTDAIGTDAIGTDAIGTDAIGRDAIGRDAIGTDAIGRDAIGRDAINRVSTTENAAPELRFHDFSDDWQVKTLGTVADRITRKNTENNQNVLTISAQYGLISQYDFFNKNVASNNVTNYYLIYKGEFAYNKSRSGGYTFGAIKPLKKYGKGVVSTLYICFGIKENYDKDFFEHYFETTIFNNKIGKIAQEGARNHGLLNISADDFFNLQIVIPTLPEQRKIAACLSSLDELIKSVRTKIDLLKKHKKGLMQKMFPSGDGMANDTDNGATNGTDNGTTNDTPNGTTNGRDAINRVSTTATTTANAVPELRFPEFSGDWQMKTLGECGETYSGLSGKNKEDFGHGDAEYITYLNVFSNSIAKKEQTDKIEIDNKQHSVKFGDVFFTTSSETPNEVGMSSVWLHNDENVYLNSFCFGYRPIIKFDSIFLSFYFRSELFRKQMTILAQGISRFNISKIKAMELLIYFPTLAEQRKIAACLSSLDAEIQKYEQKLQMLEQHKKGLMQKMFVKL